MAKARKEAWDPDFQYYYLPLAVVTPVKGLLRTPSAAVIPSAPKNATGHAFRQLIGDGANTEPPTNTQMLIVVVDEIVGDVFERTKEMELDHAYHNVEKKLRATPGWATTKQIVLVATHAEKMPPHLDFAASAKRTDILMLRESVREGGIIEASMIKASSRARAVLAEDFCRRLVRAGSTEMHADVFVDIGGEVSWLRNGAIVPTPDYVPAGCACALINAISWAYLRRSTLHLRLIVSSDALTLSRALLRLEWENDLGGMDLLAPVHIYLSKFDGKVVDVMKVRAQLETSPKRAATGAAASIWAGSRLAGALATPPTNVATPEAVVKFALAHPDICAPLLRSPSRRTVSTGCPSKFVSLETKALAKALLSHAIGTTESASSLWTRKVLPVWQERLGWTDGPRWPLWTRWGAS